MGLQSVLGWWITKCDNSGLQSVLGVGLQSVAKWITKCVRDYKVWQGGLRSVAGLQSELVQALPDIWRSDRGNGKSKAKKKHPDICIHK